MKKILVTGGDGRFAKELKKIKNNFKFIFKNKKQMNIESLNSISKNLKKYNFIQYDMRKLKIDAV